MDISKHIVNLKEYIRIDKENIEYTGDFGEFCKGHIEDIEAILKENQRLNKIIDLMAQELIDQQVRAFKDNFDPFKYINKEQVKKYFEDEVELENEE